MVKLNINLKDRSYPIYIDTDFNSIGKCIQSAGVNGKIVVVTDSNVDKLYSGKCVDILTASGFEVYKYVFEAGEKSKNLNTIKEIYKFLIEMKLDRGSALMALGGGVVGDITGFAAATFLRGISFIQVPTSLLAQADSSVGGKVGVDFEGSKNIIGAFYQPKLIYINVNALATLPERELKSGLAEVIKHGIIADRSFYEYIEQNLNKIIDLDENSLQYVVKTNCMIKGKVVEQDEKESHLRAILNFGHTIGHAVESVSNFELLHGECVSIGMVGAFKIAEYMGMVDKKVTKRISDTLTLAGLPVKITGLDIEKVYEQMFYDKKIRNSRLTFILPKDIGEVIQIKIDDTELIKKALADLSV
ncbi:MAG TPA: 3-dehydroquinate synthase [Clostridiaceae bacterium]|nr:3-dehydroquinate synthase [Clostridiaceae bacterium]